MQILEVDKLLKEKIIQITPNMFHLISEETVNLNKKNNIK